MHLHVDRSESTFTSVTDFASEIALNARPARVQHHLVDHCPTRRRNKPIEIAANARCTVPLESCRHCRTIQNKCRDASQLNGTHRGMRNPHQRLGPRRVGGEVIPERG